MDYYDVDDSSEILSNGEQIVWIAFRNIIYIWNSSFRVDSSEK